MRIHCFQHLAFETPGSILDWIAERNYSVSYTCFFEAGYLLPSLNDFDCLLVMGGCMNVYEEEKFPWLKEEKQIIAAAAKAGKKVMGICLGSQLVAAALQAKVYKAKEKEIGFLPVVFGETALRHPYFGHFAEEYHVFQWHGDTFNFPENSKHIASSAVCINQAYLLDDNVLGLQFHLEATESIIEGMLLYDGAELEEKGSWIQQADTIRMGYHYLQQNRNDIFILLDKFMGHEWLIKK